MNSIFSGFILAWFLTHPFAYAQAGKAQTRQFKVGDCLVTKNEHAWDKTIYATIIDEDSTAYRISVIVYRSNRLVPPTFVSTELKDWMSIWEVIDCKTAHEEAKKVKWGI